MSPNIFAHRNTLVTCAVRQYSRAFPLHLITPATAALMTFPPLISAASRWKIANLCPALPAIIAARTTMESPDTVIKTFTRCHHLLVNFFFPPRQCFSARLYANSSLTVRALDFQSQLRDCRPHNDCYCPSGARIFYKSGSS